MTECGRTGSTIDTGLGGGKGDPCRVFMRKCLVRAGTDAGLKFSLVVFTLEVTRISGDPWVEDRGTPVGPHPQPGWSTRRRVGTVAPRRREGREAYVGVGLTRSGPNPLHVSREGSATLFNASCPFSHRPSQTTCYGRRGRALGPRDLASGVGRDGAPRAPPLGGPTWARPAPTAAPDGGRRRRWGVTTRAARRRPRHLCASRPSRARAALHTPRPHAPLALPPLRLAPSPRAGPSSRTRGGPRCSSGARRARPDPRQEPPDPLARQTSSLRGPWAPFAARPSVGLLGAQDLDPRPSTLRPPLASGLGPRAPPRRPRPRRADLPRGRPEAVRGRGPEGK